MAARTESPKNNSPEGRSRPVALALTMFLWGAAVSLVAFLPPGQLEKTAEPAYQSISLTLAPLDGGSPPASAGQVAPAGSSLGTEATENVSGGAPVSEERAAQENVSPAPAAAVPANNPSAQKQASIPSEPVVAAVPSRPPVPAASSSAAPSQPSAAASAAALAPVPTAGAADSDAPDHQPVDPDSFDQAAWESLFAGNSTQYSNSISQGSQAAALDSAARFSGVAATTSADATSGTAGSGAASGSSRSTAESQPVAAGTTESLAGIARAAAGDPDGAGASAIGAPAVGTGSGAVAAGDGGGASLELVGGGRRRLLEPAEPVILISPESQRLIPGSLEVAITFEITPEGVVRPGSIRITPESLVHNQVQEEIKAQVGKWRFQVAEGSGQVRFKYNIMKK